MAFMGIILMYLVVILVIVGVATFTGIILLIISAVMKKRQLKKKKNAEMAGDYNYRVKKIYIIPKVLGFICMIPLLLCIVLYVYVSISGSIRAKTSLSYNVLNLNTAQVEKIIDGGVSPDYIEKDDEDEYEGDIDKTLLYMLAEGALYDQTQMQGESDEYIHGKTLEMMELLIKKGANVNYIVCREEKNSRGHEYKDEYSIYLQTDKCGWTPLMVATYHGDFDMIKLLVDNGADIHAVDYCGFNVIDIVADYLGDESGYEILNYYLDKGVDPNNVTNYHQDAVWLATRNRVGSDWATLKNDKILKTLEERAADAE